MAAPPAQIIPTATTAVNAPARAQRPDLREPSISTLESSRLAAAVGRRCAGALDGPQVAAVASAMWQGIDDVLSPLVGRRGVAALYERSCHLAQRQHAWLPEVGIDGLSMLDTESLTRAVARQDVARALAGVLCLVSHFEQLLVSLIGPALTERLLLPVWQAPCSELPGQDSTP